MADPAAVLADLAAESDALDSLVAPADRTLATPAPGWTIAHQIAHLAWTDHVAHAAVTDPQAWAAVVDAAVADPDGFVDTAAEQWSQRADLPDVWRAGRIALHEALRTTTTAKLPWFGPPMSPTSMATARLMETWAHGQDVADALGVVREPTDRIRHVAHIGVRTRDFAYGLRSQTPPSEPFRVELVAPSGELWAWGPQDAAQQITGPALHFCLLVTQRRNRDDLAVTAVGPDADRWLDIAQAFAGPPGPGRPRTTAPPATGDLDAQVRS